MWNSAHISSLITRKAHGDWLRGQLLWLFASFGGSDTSRPHPNPPPQAGEGIEVLRTQIARDPPQSIHALRKLPLLVEHS